MAEALPARPRPPLPVAISDCLLGREVRYDGGSARAAFPHTLLDGLFEFRGICPEVGIGMGVPRDPIRLVGSLEDPRVVGVDDPGMDVTDELQRYGAATAAELTDVAGYVFMQNSPSCGLFRVKVYPVDEDGVTGAPTARGRGAHAAAVAANLPDLPVEENARLNDPDLRENFIARVSAYAHWQACFAAPDDLTLARLSAFHSRYEYLLMAHSESHCRRAERLLDAQQCLADKAAAYLSVLMEGLAIAATLSAHADVLARLQGDYNRRLDSHSAQALDALISGYRRGEQPLLAPVTFLRHHLSRDPDEYVLHEAYLDQVTIGRKL